jgi:hypothetical protein
MNSSEHSKIVEPSWSGRADVPARRVIFSNTSARLPPANVPTWPANPPTIARAGGGLAPKTLRRVQDYIAINLGQKIYQ